MASDRRGGKPLRVSPLAGLGRTGRDERIALRCGGRPASAACFGWPARFRFDDRLAQARCQSSVVKALGRERLTAMLRPRCRIATSRPSSEIKHVGRAASTIVSTPASAIGSAAAGARSWQHRRNSSATVRRRQHDRRISPTASTGDARRTSRRSAIIAVSPLPITAKNQPSRPNGMGMHADQRERHDDQPRRSAWPRDWRKPERRDALEMVGAEHRGRAGRRSSRSPPARRQ